MSGMSISEKRLLLPEDIAAEGSGRIQLFDERGKVVHEQPFENFIAPGGNEWLKWMVRKSFQAAWPGVSNGGPTVDSSTVSGGAGFYPWQWGATPGDPAPTVFPFSHFCCWTDTSAEAPTTERMMAVGSSITAWVNKTAYTGADTFRGTVNAAESTTTPTMTKWVYDWPTSAGNGTFRSVGYMPINETVRGVIMPTSSFITYPSANTTDMGYGSGLSVDPVDGNLWHGPTGSTSTNRFKKFDRNTGAIVDNGFTYAQATLSGNVNGHHYDGTRHWIAHSNNMTRGTWDGTTFTKEGTWTWPSVASAGNANAQYATIASTGGASPRLFIAEGASRLQNVFEVDPSTGTVITTITVPANFYVTAIAWADSALWVLAYSSSGVLYRLNGTTFAQENVYSGMTEYTYNSGNATLQFAFYGSPNPSNWANCEILQLRTVSSTSFGRYKTKFGSIGTRSLLAAPVTKTSAQTMKITYQFDFA